MAETVLVIEDNRALQRTLRRLFESDGLQVSMASDGLEGLALFQHAAPAAVVLDLTLPHLPGKELCRAMKAGDAAVPVIVLSANAEVQDKILLLELGADDYVTKPFSPKELLARVRRAMRRQQRASVAAAASGAPLQRLCFGDVCVNFAEMVTTRAGNLIELTALEYKVVTFFARFPNRVFSRSEMLNQIWGYDNYPSTRTVDNCILRLRQKLEPDPVQPRYFLTMHGAGYKFVPSGDLDRAGIEPR